MSYVLIFILMIALFAAWITHIVVCIATASWGLLIAGAFWGLLIAGAIMFPVGIIHGVGVWFGAW